MKIKELQISNVLSFKYFENMDDATKVTFDDNLNILIWENGAWKSTVLEIINFIFKRVLFTQFIVNQDLYSQKNTIKSDEKKQILLPKNNQSYSGFRLEPNWNTDEKSQTIKITIKLDAIDIGNIQNLIQNKEKLGVFATKYANHSVTPDVTSETEYVLTINLSKGNQTFSVNISNSSDAGYLYLVNYNFYKELINFYNLENSESPISPLYESFTLISGYRNYSAFTPTIGLQTSTATQQIQWIRTKDFSKGINAIEQTEPDIFSLVRLRVAEKHYDLFGTWLKEPECEEKANQQTFLSKINKRLRLVKLEARIKLTDRAKWQYSFQFYDLKRNQPLPDINSLSAGQKAIIHLVFEAYWRGDLKGGLVIIDEPEVHLHHQFQNEYLRVIEEINKDQECQYILVTHSESLINSETISSVKRLALNQDGETIVKIPRLWTEQKILIKILDNTRSTYAFFAKKVVLVEGDTDRFFFKSVLQEKRPELNQEIVFLDVGGKNNFIKWKEFFEEFGLIVYCIGDLDSARQIIYWDTSNTKEDKLDSTVKIQAFKEAHSDLFKKIKKKYREKIYILKDGDIETYLWISKRGKWLPAIINFCSDNLKDFLSDKTNEKSKEILSIFKQITK
ncbi:MAG: hypothetical protein ACD_71C00177G0002 [uncultured bacterium (gcode 4)]|uniref:Uncharacterized protein n=1 Tax=uncultured bacterium (gcode 4) TaxID=1234023 RepID=K1YMY4_9BACT|nr:MAG: hypothetical protein ACD_71C00177G0002 [uncultured bacterium (gcode 4)]